MLSFFKKNSALVLITLFGFALRVAFLGKHSLWLDEFFSWLASTRPGFAELLSGVRADELTPPVFFIVQWLFGHFLDDSEFGIRLPSMLAGVAAVPATYLLGREAFGRRAGLLGALLFACTYQTIYFSQEARAYSLVILLTALSSWQLLVLMREFSRRRMLSYIALASLLALTHYFGAIMVFVQGVTWLILAPRSRKTLVRWFGVYGAVVAVFAVWMLYLLLDFSGRPSRLEDFNGGEIFVYHRWLFGGSSVYGIVSTLAIVAMIVHYARNKDSRARMTAVFLLWVFLPFVVAYALAVKVMAIYTIRYMVIGLPAIFVLTGAGVADLYERLPRRGWLVGGFAAGLCVFLGLYETIVARGLYTLPKSEQVRESVEWVRDEALKRFPESAIVTSSMRAEFINLYLDRLGVGRHVDYWAPDEAALGALSGRLDPKWRYLIFLAPGVSDRASALPQALLKSYPLEDEKLFNRAGVWVMRTH